MTFFLKSDQKCEWNKYIDRAFQYDFYHTNYYHTINDRERAFLFVYDNGSDFIAFPLIKRQIEGTDLHDLTCVYGYPGPFSNKPFDEIDDFLALEFKKSFLSFLKEGKFVSVFSRLHPFISQESILDKIGGIFPNGKTVAIDLTVSDREQEAKYRRNVKSTIKHCKNKGYYIKESNKKKDLDIFMQIYNENMQRVNASNCYYFKEEYLWQLLQADEFHSTIVFVYAGDEAISATLIGYSNEIIQGHLLATRTAYLPESPSKFLIHEVCKWGKEKGLKYYHLGGGLGFQDDSLLYWKMGFSDLILNYNSFRYIADVNQYKALVDSLDIDPNSTVDFFPLYRSKIAKSKDLLSL